MTLNILNLESLLYTAMNSPSLIFTLMTSETDSLSFEFAHFLVSFKKLLFIIQLTQFKICPQIGEGKRMKIKRRKFPCIQFLCLSTMNLNICCNSEYLEPRDLILLYKPLSSSGIRILTVPSQVISATMSIRNILHSFLNKTVHVMYEPVAF